MTFLFQLVVGSTAPALRKRGNVKRCGIRNSSERLETAGRVKLYWMRCG